MRWQVVYLVSALVLTGTVAVMIGALYAVMRVVEWWTARQDARRAARESFGARAERGWRHGQEPF